MSTPSKGYGAVPLGGIDVASATALIAQFTGGDAENMVKVGREKVNSLIKYAEEGDWTWKILGFFGGLAMIGTGGLSFMGDFFLFNYFGAVMDVYIILFGIVTCVLEYKNSFLPVSWVNKIKIEAKFMYRPYGRAVLYLFFGVLLISQQSLLFLCTGLYLCGIGIIVIYFAGQAQKALDNFKAKKLSYSQLKTAYNNADKNRDGLAPKEIAKVVSNFPGCALSENEVESAIGLLDKDGNGKVSFDEFEKWYNAR